MPEIAKLDGSEAKELGEFMTRARALFDFYGVPLSNKTIDKALVAERLRVQVDGLEGVLGHTGKRVGQLSGLTSFVVEGGAINRQGMQVVKGH